MHTEGTRYLLYVFGQTTAVAVVLCVLLFYLLKLTRIYQYVEPWFKSKAATLRAKINNIFASLQVFPSVKTINTKTSSSTSKYKSTPETTNLARVARLILGPCTDLLREILRANISPSDLSKTVKIWIDDLKKKKIKNPLNKQQIALIFPLPTKQYGGDYSDFDISFLYILLRNVCKISPHNKGWGEEPDPTDNSVSANIERIRLTRNKYYGHAADFSLSESNFIREWQSIYNITVELERCLGSLTLYQNAVNDIKTCSMDPEIEARYIEKLLLLDELCETVKTHSEEITKLQHATSVIHPNIKDVHQKKYIRCWKEEDSVFNETHNFPAMLDKVRTQSYMTFVGVPGSGKSATIHHIALILQEEGYEVVPIIDISEVYRFCDSNNPQVFVIDDVVGVLGLQKQKLQALVDYEKIISDPPNKRTKVLMTCRELVFNECYKSFFSNKENVIKMLSSENALNDDDKKAILQKHGLDKDLLSPTLLREASAMFPLLCKLYSKEEKFRNDVERFFTCPSGYILEEFDKMKEQNRLQYATLILCLLNDNKLSKEILKDTGNKVFCEIKSKALENCKVKSNTDAFEFVDALSVMEGTYTKLCGTEYTFIHDSMFEIIAHHFGSRFPNIMLQFMSSSYIANYVKLQKDEMHKLENENKHVRETIVVNSGGKKEINTACDSLRNGKKEALSAENSDRMEAFDLCIRIGEDLYSRLAERLYRDIQNMELYDVFMNKVLKHPTVCQAFIEVLETKSYTELKSLFLSEQKDVSKVVSKKERVREESEKRDERSRERRRQSLLVIENDDDKEITYSVRVISWVVYYGHTQILQYILKQTELHKETQSELFFNFFNQDFIYSTKDGEKNIEAHNKVDKLRSFTHLDIDGSISEQQRLLLLSCYNGTIEIVRIFIKYLKRNTIYTTYPDIDLKFMLGDTALQAACIDGLLSVVKELIEAGADLNSVSKFDFDTPLTAACKGGYMNIAKELLGAGADINHQGYFNTPLTAACENGYIRLVKELVRTGADVNIPSLRDGDTPLTAACEGGYIDIVKELVKAGAGVNFKSTHACGTPLTVACKGGYIDIVEELVRVGADINLQDKNDTPLTTAVKYGHISIVKNLLQKGVNVNQCVVNYSTGVSDTPLTVASKGGYKTIVEELLGAGADVNPQDVDDIPLSAAIKGRYMSVVKQLLKAGACVNLRGKSNNSPLVLACKDGNMSVVKKLIKSGADVNLLCEDRTALTAACEGGHLYIVRELLQAGAIVNLQGEYLTPLTAACENGHLKIVQELLQAEADVNFQCEYLTPLTAACEGGHINLVKELLEAGAYVNPQSKKATPLITAIKGGRMSIVKDLLKAGANVNLQDTYNDTPLTAACKIGQISFVKELLDAGADVNLQNEHETSLIAACFGGYLSIVMELIKAGAVVNLQTKSFKSYTSLTAACCGGHGDVVEELVKAGADVNLHGKYYELWKRILLRDRGMGFSRKESFTPLTIACDSGYINIVKRLLKARADVNPHGEHFTPLTAAIKSEHFSIVMELLKAGADVNLKDKIDTPLTAACGSGHVIVVKELLQKSADVNLHGKVDTPLTAACKSGYMNIAKILLDAGSDVNMQDKEGNTPLYHAFVNTHKSFIPLILRMFDIYGADSTIRNKQGISTFYHALIRNEIGSVKQLLRTENESQLDRLRLHLFECLVNIRHSDVMTDSKDDVVVTRRRVWRMEERWGDLYEEIIQSDCKGLEHLLRVGLDVNQWIQLYNDYKDVMYDVKPLLFALIDDYDFDNRLVDKVKFLLEAGVDVNVMVKYKEYDSMSDSECNSDSVSDSECNSVLDSEYGSVLDREGVSVLERTRRLVSEFRKDEWKRDEVFKYTRVIKEVKKHARRYSV
ncbi:uncharacterized protein LOC134279820 [Saccostrea cucullata]|uniref:uncharacterized protein LOC134279820 n=1 Tax=Saccostrea cuccullata TaxID=36930 RepID=UPI002ED27371